MVCPDTSGKRAAKAAAEIEARFKEFWNYGGRIANLNARIVQTGSDEGINNIDKLFKIHG